ncbi:hypothetical protein DIPPA_02487 [Diplonema papillatum]|nr:hypothetical protein DIPPA_02487 [Diplonema papillatum]
MRSTNLDYLDLRSIPLLSEFIEGHGDTTVYFSSVLRELVPGGLAVNRLVFVTELAFYKIPQTASDTGIFFNSRYPLENLTQVLVIDHDTTQGVQFNGVKPGTGERTLFTLQFTDEKRKAECMLTLAQLFPGLPILRKTGAGGKVHTMPFVDGLRAARDPSPARHAEPPWVPPGAASTARQREGVRYLFDAASGPPPPPQPAVDPQGMAAAAPRQHAAARGPLGAGDAGHRAAFGGGFGRKDAPPARGRVPLGSDEVDYAFEMHKAYLRERLYDHDFTNAALRAALSLRADDGDDFAGAGGGAGTQAGEHFASKKSEAATDASATSTYTGTDPESLQRRFLMEQEQERVNLEREREKREIEQMLAGLESGMERVVHREALRQEGTQRRIAQRQRRTDEKLKRLRDDYKQARVRQYEAEERTRQKHKKEREALYRSLSAARDRETSALARLTHPTKSTAPPRKPFAEERQHDLTEAVRIRDRILVGGKTHDAYVQWRQSGGLVGSDKGAAAWAKSDSEGLARALVSVLKAMTDRGDKTEDVVRVRGMLGNVRRELDMVENRNPPEISLQAAPSTAVEPFNLSAGTRSHSKRVSNQQFKDELTDREQKYTEAQQRIRKDHLQEHDEGGRGASRERGRKKSRSPSRSKSKKRAKDSKD